MKSNKQIANRKHIWLLKFDIIFALINGLVFAGLFNADGNGGYGPVILTLYALAFDALISIGHGYVTYAELHSFFIPQLLFYISWVVSLLPVFFALLPEENYFFDILIMASVFLLFSCFGALVAKIVMVFKKRYFQHNTPME